jgi:hypothetical protein
VQARAARKKKRAELEKGSLGRIVGTGSSRISEGRKRVKELKEGPLGMRFWRDVLVQEVNGWSPLLVLGLHLSSLVSDSCLASTP